MKKPRWVDYLDLMTEKPALESLYVRFKVPTDQLRRHSTILTQITRAFKSATGRDDVTPSTLLSYMVNRRKAKEWPVLGKQARKTEHWSTEIDESEIEVLREFYMTLREPSDEYLCRPSLSKRLEEHFFKRVRRRVAGAVLVAAILAKRKRGLWPTLTDGKDWGFNDIRKVG